ncbi:hypothetical protein J2Y63_000068 [Shinella sp. BE166]
MRSRSTDQEPRETKSHARDYRVSTRVHVPHTTAQGLAAPPV